MNRKCGAWDQDIVVKIVALRNAGLSYRKIARRIGYSHMTIKRIYEYYDQHCRFDSETTTEK